MVKAFSFGGPGKRAQKVLDWELPGIVARIDRLESAPPPKPDLQPVFDKLAVMMDPFLERMDKLGVVEKQIAELEAKLEDMTIAISDGIERVDRAERRVTATIQSARKKFKDGGYVDPGLEAEAAELRVRDGDGGAEVGVPPLPEGVEPPLETPSSIPGVSLEQMRRFRGF